MTQIPQYNPTGIRIPFWILANSGNFPGAAGANPAIELNQPNSDLWVQSTGTITDVGNGAYRYTPSAQDAAIPGIVAARVVGPSTDIEPPIPFEVCAPSWLSQLIAMPQNLATAVSLLQRLATAQRA